MSQEFQIQRKLAAVFAADVAGFSRLISADENGTLRELASQRGILDATIAKYRGRIVNTAGDSVLAEFPSVSDAVLCAVEAQGSLKKNAAALPAEKRIQFRVGIHIGDVTIHGTDLLGNGVNIAARLESIAEPDGVVISAAAYEQVRKTLSLPFVDLGDQSLKGIDDVVRAFAIGATAPRSPAQEPAGPGKALPLPDKPSVAVLPFQNLSGDAEQDYFADGIVEDVITALSRFKSLFVIARNSSFTYKGKAADIKQVGRELGVRYVLEGSVRKAGGRVRVTAQLIDSASGIQLWAEKFDGASEDIFAIQDQVTAQVCGRIAPKVEEVEIERARNKSTTNLVAYDYYLRGIAGHDSWTRAGNDEALSALLKAIELDPRFTAAMARVCSCYTQRQQQGWMSDPEAEAARAVALANQALRLDRTDAAVMAWASFCIASFLDELERCLSIAEDAVALNPSLYVAHLLSGVQHVWCGHPETAIERYLTALRLNPVDPLNFTALTGLAGAYFHAGHTQLALDSVEKALARNLNYDPLLRLAAIVHATVGNIDRARGLIGRLLEINPNRRISNTQVHRKLRRREDQQRLIEGLRIAGLPE